MLRSTLVSALCCLAVLPLGAAVLEEFQVQANGEGQQVSFKADAAVKPLASALHKPERVLVNIKGATLKGSKLPKQQSFSEGLVRKIRFSQKDPKTAQAVLELSQAAPHALTLTGEGTFSVLLGVTSLAQAGPQAKAPLVNLMLFDLDVNYQGKHYERYPCANLIYTASDAFPLERSFSTVMVFHHGFGAFTGSAKVLDPSGQVLAQSTEPISFKLHNSLADAMVELPWKVQFKDKGLHKLTLELNGTEVLYHEFYVGHNTDTLPTVP